MKNWEKYYEEVAIKKKQSWLSVDVATAITIRLLGCENPQQIKNYNFQLLYI